MAVRWWWLSQPLRGGSKGRRIKFIKVMKGSVQSSCCHNSYTSSWKEEQQLGRTQSVVVVVVVVAVVDVVVMSCHGVGVDIFVDSYCSLQASKSDTGVPL